MKKRFFLLFFLVVLILFVVMGCKETIVGPIVKKYTVETTSGPNGIISPSGKTEVISGGAFKLTITPNPGFKVVIKVNDIGEVLIGNTYSLIVDKDYKIEVSFITILSWYLMQGEWTRDSIIAREDDGTWSHQATSFPDVVTFLPNGRFTIYLDGVLVGNGDWSINEATNPPILNWGEIVEIEKLNATTLILAKYDVQCIGCVDPNHIGAHRIILSHH